MPNLHARGGEHGSLVRPSHMLQYPHRNRKVTFVLRRGLGSFKSALLVMYTFCRSLAIKRLLPRGSAVGFLLFLLLAPF